MIVLEVQHERSAWFDYHFIPLSHFLTAIPSAMATDKSTVNGRYNICRYIGSGSFGTDRSFSNILQVSLNVSRKDICRL
jgi:hypothetical protein